MSGNKYPMTPQKMASLIIFIFVIILVLSSISTVYYTVNTDENAVVTFLGKFNRVTGPGLHFKLPFGIERAEKVKVTTIFKEEFGYKTIKPGVQSTFDEQKQFDTSLMLCGDLSVAEVQWIVQYRVKDPKKYLFNIRDPQKIIRDTSESVMRMIVGDSSVDEVLTERRIEINDEVHQMMQTVLDSYESGISVEAVRLQDVNPPEEVRSAFNEVNAAQQDKEKMINQAAKEYNQIIPKVKGQAQQMIKQAEAYAVERVNEAEGNASRFVATWQEYKLSPDVTRRRLYLEAMNEVLPGIEKKYIIDNEVQSVLPLMQLGGK
ncbi:Modulator of FtsH protease HflK [Limihaloglobus sulfuriphilus]|uniref:Protein HflK n=1 Tax=Limihaloglobus sulfuriphilus TaxID=1851148 RepID=A0A1Q2MBC7_9BACT|nr:FtsH protease activity modulator HflK [Limihaloglobus sulfuriphilus]AQQ69981.1 Modulator of FtsH protease HflK [Limihaloglobus sulfuriphilus]